MRDSGTGPDHIFYSYWRNAPYEFKLILYQAYCEFLRTGSLAPDFNFSYLTFLPKGEDVEDSIYQVRVPEKTRPLNLSNTDNKIIAHCIAHPFNTIAPQKIHPAQHGGGRVAS